MTDKGHDEYFYKAHAERFEKEDPNKPSYSMLEYDVYGNYHSPDIIQRFRVSIRKNLKEGKYEVFRHYLFDIAPDGILHNHGHDEVIFSSPLIERAFEFAENDAKEIKETPDQNQGSGRCRRCHRKLTKPESVARGYGSSCWAKIKKGE